MAAHLADLVTEAAERLPRRTALVEAATGHAVSWAELDAEVSRLAEAYREAGLHPGQRVALGAATTIASCAGLFAVWRAGGVVVPIDPDSPTRVRYQVVEQAGARFLLGFETGWQRPTEISTTCAAVDGDAAELAVICFTSGTAAGARGVCLPHRALLANVEQCARVRPPPVTATDRVLLGLPLYHSYGLSAALLQTVAAGATGVLLERFTAEDALTAIADYRVTTVPGVPLMFGALLGQGADRLGAAMPSVRLLTSGAAPLPEPVRLGMRAATGLQIFAGYGLTEAGPVVTWSLASGVTKPGSVGRPIPGVRVRLVDTDGGPLPEPDESGDDRGVGRIAVHGPNLFTGYWPDGAGGPGPDGWFVTDDVGYLDQDGDLHLIDRGDDRILVHGFTVFPHEVEDVLTELPGVREAAVLGVPDERSGEVVKAVLVIDGSADAELDAARVRAHCAARLARFKVPREVTFADELPHSVTGKLQRRRLDETAAPT